MIKALYPCAPLGRSMPEGVGYTVSAGEYQKRFGQFAGLDVWTADGWLIVGGYSDQITYQMRKDSEYRVSTVLPHELLLIAPRPGRDHV